MRGRWMHVRGCGWAVLCLCEMLDACSVETDRRCTDAADVGGGRYAKTRRLVLGGIAVNHSSNATRLYTTVLASTAASHRLCPADRRRPSSQPAASALRPQHRGTTPQKDPLHHGPRIVSYRRQQRHPSPTRPPSLYAPGRVPQDAETQPFLRRDPLRPIALFRDGICSAWRQALARLRE